MKHQSPATILERLYQRVEDAADLDIYPTHEEDTVIGPAAEELNMLQEAMIMLELHCSDWYNAEQ